MPYNQQLDKDIDVEIMRWKGMQKKNMFGGICHLLNGNMCFGIYKDSLIVRAGQEAAEKILKEPGTKPFDITGKSMKGWVMVEASIWKKSKNLKRWLALGKKFASRLPAKQQPWIYHSEE